MADSSLTPISAARLQQEATNAAINAEVNADMREFLLRQQRLGGDELVSLSSVSDWARQSDWSIDTGGERDARGAPVRATGGVWAEMFFQAQAQLVVEARERQQWREYFEQRRELRLQSRAAAESDGRLTRRGLERVAQMMGFVQGDAIHAIVSQLDDVGSVDIDVLEAWWGARGLYIPHSVSLQAEKELLEAWEKTVSFKVGRRRIPAAWRRDFFDALEQRKLAVSELQTPRSLPKQPLGSPLKGARAKPTRRRQRQVDSGVASKPDSSLARPAGSDIATAPANVESPRTPLRQKSSGVASVGVVETPSRTQASGKSLDIALRRNSALGCPANALHLPSPARTAATSGYNYCASPLLVEQRLQIGDLRAESDLLRRALAKGGDSRGLDAQVPCRIFEHFVVVGAASNASFMVQSAAEQVSSWWRPAERKRFEEYASLWVGSPQALRVYPKSTDATRTNQICSLCFPDSEGVGSFTLWEHSGLTPGSQDGDDGLELDYSVFVMNDSDAASVAVGEAPPRLYGACIRTVELVYASRRANRCWTLPRVYCLVSRLPCLQALFSLLLAVVHQERASHATTECARALLGSPRSSSAFLSREPIASPFTPGAASAFGNGEQCQPPAEADTNATKASTGEGSTSSTVYAYVEHRSMAFSVEIPSRVTLDVNNTAGVNGRELRVNVPSSWRCRETETDIVPAATVVNIGETHGLTVCLPSQTNPRPRLRVDYAGDVCYDDVLRGNAYELAAWSLGDALEAAGPRAMAQLVAALLAERRVVVVCKAASVRTAVVLAGMALVGPSWPHLCLPLLCITPEANMTEMILAPVPYVIGLPTLDVLEEEVLGELFQFNDQQESCPPCVLMVTTESSEGGCGAASWHRHGSMPPTYSLSSPDSAGQPGRLQDDLGGVLEAASADVLRARDLRDFEDVSKATESLLVAVKQCHGRLHARCLAAQRPAAAGHGDGQIGTPENSAGAAEGGFVGEYMRSVLWQELVRSICPAEQEQSQEA